MSPVWGVRHRRVPNFRLDLQAGLLRETAKKVDRTAEYVGVGGDYDCRMCQDKVTVLTLQNPAPADPDHPPSFSWGELYGSGFANTLYPVVA